MLRDTKDVPVAIIRCGNSIVIDIVLVGPGTCQQALVGDSRYCRTSRRPSGIATHIGSRITTLARYIIKSRGLHSFQDVSRDTVQQNKNGFALFFR